MENDLLDKNFARIIEDVIESCHNGIVAWEKPTNLKPIFISQI